MNSSTNEYREKVWQFLEKIKPGQTYTVAKLTKTKNREQFVNEIKEYMKVWPWQGNITFNKDYSKFYKMDPIN